MVLKGSVNFGPRGSTALGFGGHAHRAFPNKKYDTYKGHYTDVIGDSENEKSVAFKLYPIIKDWLKLRN